MKEHETNDGVNEHLGYYPSTSTILFDEAYLAANAFTLSLHPQSQHTTNQNPSLSMQLEPASHTQPKLHLNQLIAVVKQKPRSYIHGQELTDFFVQTGRIEEGIEFWKTIVHEFPRYSNPAAQLKRLFDDTPCTDFGREFWKSERKAYSALIVVRTACILYQEKCSIGAIHYIDDWMDDDDITTEVLEQGISKTGLVNSSKEFWDAAKVLRTAKVFDFGIPGRVIPLRRSRRWQTTGYYGFKWLFRELKEIFEVEGDINASIALCVDFCEVCGMRISDDDLSRLAFLLWKEGNLSLSEAVWRRISEIYPTTVDGFISKVSKALEKFGNQRVSKHTWEGLFRNFSGSLRVVKELAKLCQDLGEFERVISLGSSFWAYDSTLMRLITQAHISKGDIAGGIKFWLKRINPASIESEPAVMKELKILLDMELGSTVLDVWTQLYSEFPYYYPQGSKNLSQLLCDNGRLDEAVEIYKFCVKRNCHSRYGWAIDGLLDALGGKRDTQIASEIWKEIETSGPCKCWGCVLEGQESTFIRRRDDRISRLVKELEKVDGKD